jgi:hypothetical protein
MDPATDHAGTENSDVALARALASCLRYSDGARLIEDLYQRGGLSRAWRDRLMLALWRERHPPSWCLDRVG